MNFPTARNQGEIGVRQQTININNQRVQPSAATGLSTGDGRVTCAPANTTVNGGGPFRGFGNDRERSSPERIAKAQAFWHRLQERRKDPANCCRCGKPRTSEKRQCAKCLAYQAKYRGKLVDKDVKLTGSVVVAMVKQMRREMNLMQTRFKQWQKAANYRRDLRYRTNTMRKKYLKQFSPAQVRDYLAETNHVYESQA